MEDRGSESQIDRKTFSSFSFRLRRSRLARPSSSRATVAQHFAWPRRVGMLRVLHRSQDKQMIFKTLDTTVGCKKLEKQICWSLNFRDLDHFKARAARHGNEMDWDLSGVLEVVDTVWPCGDFTVSSCFFAFFHNKIWFVSSSFIFWSTQLQFKMHRSNVLTSQKMFPKTTAHRSHCGTCLVGSTPCGRVHGTWHVYWDVVAVQSRHWWSVVWSQSWRLVDVLWIIFNLDIMILYVLIY